MKKGKTTLCVTTGEVYVSAKQAADAHGIKYATINALCDGRQKAHHGLVFCYMEDAPYKIDMIAKGIRMKNETMLRKQLQNAKTKMDDARAKYEAAQAEYDSIMAKIGQ